MARRPSATASQPANAGPTWTFPARFRSRAFSWKGTALATQRMKEAITEIKAVQRKDPFLAADGAVRLIECIVPAIEQIDGSSGAIGTAVTRTVNALVDIIAAAPASARVRTAWLDRLWEAYNNDGYGYLDHLPDRWGDLCASPELANIWADNLAPTPRLSFSERTRMPGGSAALFCLQAAGRHAEIVEIVALLQYEFWDYQRFAVQALIDLGRPEEALRYAESRNSPNDGTGAAAACERILRLLGRHEEAYRRYGLYAHRVSTHLATFRSLAKAYPEVAPPKLLADLVASTPREEGKWFATAKELELCDDAIALANRSPCDPKTLIRAARDHEEAAPLFALNAGLTALRWLRAGHGYDLVGNEPFLAFDHALRAADRAGEREQAPRAMASIVDPERGATNWAGDALRRLHAGAPRVTSSNLEE